MATPSFDQWIAHWFAPKRGGWRWATLSARKATGYMTLLFESPRVLTRFPAEQIGSGLHATCGSESGYLRNMRSPQVPIPEQVRCIRAILILYRDLFARVCTNHYGHLDDGPEPPSPINSACYMLWDMDQLEGAAMFPGSEHLVSPIFEVLAGALELESLACRESALHGLGHLARYHSARVNEIIDRFVNAHPQVPRPLAQFARMARSGRVQ